MAVEHMHASATCARLGSGLGLGLGLGLGFARTRLAVREEARVLARERRLEQRHRALGVDVALRGGGPKDGGRELQVRAAVDRDPRTDALLAADAYLRSGVCVLCGWCACGVCV